MTMLRVLLQGPGCISKYRNFGYAKKKNGHKIGETIGMVGENVGGVVAGSRVHFKIWTVWLCKNQNTNKIGKKTRKK
jgi:hypothetical protein